MPYRYAMSSVHKQGKKPNWFCAYYDPEGFRKFKSTGTENIRIAKTVCLTFERASDLARKGRLSSDKALKLVRDAGAAIEETHGKIQADKARAVMQTILQGLVAQAGGELKNYTVRVWLDEWLKGRTDASKATRAEYRSIVDRFLKFIGARANSPLATIETAQVKVFRDKLESRVAPSTVNKALKCLSAAFGAAVKQRQLEFNPAQHVSHVELESAARRGFTLEELNKLLNAASEDWHTMILVGYYTGLRLADCAGLTWEHVDILKASISVVPKKTSRNKTNGRSPELKIPIAAPLAKHLATIAGDNPHAPLCPNLHGRASSWLSGRFYEVMAKAGLVKERDEKKKGKGKGRDAKRALNEISFHSLRHNLVSALKSSGASNAIAMDIAGHATEAISREYTEIEFGAKQAAVEKLPDITKEPPKQGKR